MNRVMAKSRDVVNGIKSRPRFAVMTVAVVILLLWMFMSSNQISGRADRALDEIGNVNRLAESQQLLIDKLATQLDAARAQGAVIKSPEQVAAEVPGLAEVSPIEGAQGERGEAGLPGATGATGIGIAGNQGDPGATGATGSQGATGETGGQGTPGIGVAGANGADGVAGPAGPQGDPGASGPAGADGQPGTPGADGAAGAPGATGATGPPPSSWTFSIGAVNYECTPTPADPTVFTCTVVP